MIEHLRYATINTVKYLYPIMEKNEQIKESKALALVPTVKSTLKAFLVRCYNIIRYYQMND